VGVQIVVFRGQIVVVWVRIVVVWVQIVVLGEELKNDLRAGEIRKIFLPQSRQRADEEEKTGK
jgi:hypothetical protein